MPSSRVAILIAAMGGEGGGVLADWIVRAAQSAGLAVQLTSIPGVAQRTGATTYYIEMIPPDGTRRSNSAPVLALNPALGEVDIMMATELLEAARAAANGFMSPERTILIGSTHRVFSTAEKMEMGDGRYDAAKLLRVVKDNSRERILFDMEQAAEESGSVLNAVLLGALAVLLSTGDFTVDYVARSITSNLSAPYRIAALWNLPAGAVLPTAAFVALAGWMASRRSRTSVPIRRCATFRLSPSRRTP